MIKKKNYPCTFPIYTKDGFVVRCWHCHNCKKFVTYLETEIKKQNNTRQSFNLKFSELRTIENE